MANKNKQSLKDLLRFSNPYSGLNKKEKKASKRYGIDLNSYGFNHPEGRNSASPKRDPKNFQSDIAAAANADYDTRRSIEAAALSGNKKAEKYAKGGFNSLKDVTKANNMFRRMHARHGNGGDFSSQSDYSGLTYDLVKKDREQINGRDFKDNYISERFGSRDNSNNESTKAEVEIPPAPSAFGDGSINSPITQANPQTVTGDNNVASQTNAIEQFIDNRDNNSDNSSRMFLDDYKLNLGSKLNLKSFS